ncbi:hypothetical protein BD410DRAFT_837205 [Rickenella mellea]|uniref:Uncharacterized protein n=1 Tax=Rickenella mellea TaxID=50990 RepID=A0A4Y7QDP3_9AGAM|nr:hypothetical protein BD410DRAFT_837205 [Rickenella mellea]
MAALKPIDQTPSPPCAVHTFMREDFNVDLASPRERTYGYLKGYGMLKTLAGLKLKDVTVKGEDIESLLVGVCEVLSVNSPAARLFPFHSHGVFHSIYTFYP